MHVYCIRFLQYSFYNEHKGVFVLTTNIPYCIYRVTAHSCCYSLATRVDDELPIHNTSNLHSAVNATVDGTTGIGPVSVMVSLTAGPTQNQQNQQSINLVNSMQADTDDTYRGCVHLIQTVAV